MDLLFAGVAVADFPAAVDWYGRLFGREPDVLVHDHEVMWQVAEAGWLYVVEDAERAGKALVTVSVSDLDAAVHALGERGITAGPVEAVGDAAHKAKLTDPDGNSVALIHVAASPGWGN
jgi:catechol 2,3-dioxygenase-like lactoylglutathione lyase family enzyme